METNLEEKDNKLNELMNKVRGINQIKKTHFESLIFLKAPTFRILTIN